MRTHISDLVDILRVSAASRWTAVRQLRWQTRAVLSECRARRRWGGAAAAPPAGTLRRPTDEWLDAEVCGVIARHPDGIGALEIGNELGVDWRLVPAAAARLIERGVVEQIGPELYPAKKAS